MAVFALGQDSIQKWQKTALFCMNMFIGEGVVFGLYTGGFENETDTGPGTRLQNSMLMVG